MQEQYVVLESNASSVCWPAVERHRQRRVQKADVVCGWPVRGPTRPSATLTQISILDGDMNLGCSRSV
jgi:hypothetical protein